MPPRPIFVCLLFLIAIGLTPPRVKVLAGADSSLFLYTATKHYDALAWMHGADRFPSGATIWLHDSAGERPLAPGFAASADAALSFDGRRVLFAGKLKSQDPWQIWEISLDGGEFRRITSGREDCIRPFYLPDGRLIYARRTAGRFLIESGDLTGGKPLPLTYGPANFLPTDVLRDGRVLFEAGYPLGPSVVPELYTVYSDGSGVESYRCDHGNARFLGRQISSGDIVFVSRNGVGRFTSAQARQISVSVPAGNYAGEIAETPSGDWLLSWRPDAKAHFQLMLWTPGSSMLRPVVKGQSVSAVQPVLIGEHAIPKRHPSGLHDWPDANLLCLNAYTSKYRFAQGSIHAVRLYTRDGAGKTMLLGTSLVERDGSFCVHVPTEQPLQIELLDRAGRTLKRESGFFWMRHGEQRACVGCHAGPETAPENAVPMILLKSTTPTDMTHAQNASGGH